MMLAPVLLMLVIPRMMKNLDPESQKVATYIVCYNHTTLWSICTDNIIIIIIYLAIMERAASKALPIPGCFPIQHKTYN